MRTHQLVPTWLKLQYPVSKYAQNAIAGNWLNITTSSLTTKERAMAVSLRWRWLALMNQNESFAEMIPSDGIRNYTLDQIKNTKQR